MNLQGTGRQPAERLGSLDVFRGLTIAAMILVNNAGDWSKTYRPLLHAAPDYAASLAWALTYVVIWLGLMTVLYRRRIFLKI